jgi:ribosomal protein L4
MEIQVLNQKGSKDSKIELSEHIFGQAFNEDLVHQLITTYIANSHQGTKGQKNRSAVRGGGRKLEAKRNWQSQSRDNKITYMERWRSNFCSYLPRC